MRMAASLPPQASPTTFGDAIVSHTLMSSSPDTGQTQAAGCVQAFPFLLVEERPCFLGSGSSRDVRWIPQGYVRRVLSQANRMLEKVVVSGSVLIPVSK